MPCLSKYELRDLKTKFEKKIERFLKQNSEHFKPALKKTIKNMLKNTKYKNGQSLERHNWGYNKKRLNIKDVPESVKTESIDNPDKLDEWLIHQLQEEGINDQSILEILWGDIQLGKRIHALIIMWISIYILKRPVLYIFRNLKIDQDQLMGDVYARRAPSCFAMKYIIKQMEEFNEELRKEGILDDDGTVHTKFLLPE